MQGILLSGGNGTRLWPMTIATSKQLLPVYDKPLVYYPLSTLMLSGVRDIVVITTPNSAAAHQNLLKDGSQWGINISYAVQNEPKGIPDAFNVAESLLDTSKGVVLILGDNFFYGPGLGQDIFSRIQESMSICFCYEVSNPSEFGVVELDSNGFALRIVEKPETFISKMAVSGLYKFPNDVFTRVKELSPSSRGELEIVDLLNSYIADRLLDTRFLSRGTAWLDTGTTHGLLGAGNFVQVLQERQGLLVGSPDEVAWRLGLINSEKLSENAMALKGSDYGKKLLTLI